MTSECFYQLVPGTCILNGNHIYNPKYASVNFSLTNYEIKYSITKIIYCYQ